MPATLRALSLLALLAVLAPAALPQEAGEKPLSEEPPKPPALDGDQKVYVPFKNLKDVFEKEGQGVFVPYAEFLKLWEANLDRRPLPADPPVPFAITRAAYEGRVDGDVAALAAEIAFTTFGKGWTAVPLGFAGIAFSEATIGGAPATLEGTKDGYRVLVDKPGEYVLSVRFVTAVAKSEDARTVSFRMPPTPVSRLIFDVPEEGAKVSVEPNLATTRTEPGSGVTRVMAYVGAAEALSITWKPRPPEAVKGPSLVFADTVLAASIEETSLRVRADVGLTVHRTPAETVRLVLEPEANVLFVEGNEVRSWEYDAAAKAVVVRLTRPVSGACRILLTLENPRPESGEVRLPAVRVEGAARDQGYVTLATREAVKVDPAVTNLLRTDFDGLPAGASRENLLFAWRYPAHPFSVTLAVTKLTPVVDVMTRTVVTLDERRLTQVDTFTFEVARVGIFTARIPVPEGVTVTDVTRDFVEDWRVLPDRTLFLEFKGSRMGAFSVQVTSTREVGLADAPLDLALPVLAPDGARRTEGILGVRRDEGLKVETKEAAGCEPMDAAEFGGGASMAYRYRAAGRRVVLTVSRREPEVAARVVTELRAEQNRVAVKTRLTWTIRYAGVESFSFLLPAALKDKVRVTGNNVREKPLADAGEGLVRQRVVLQGKVLGEYPVEIEYDLPYEGLKAGDKVDVAVPVLAVEGVVREEGFYAVWRDPALEILADADRVEPIDPRELPAGTDGAAAFLAFKYLARPHGLTLKIEKHDFLPVLAAVAHHMHLTTVLNEEGTARTEMIVALTNNGMQFLSIALPAGARAETLEVWAPDDATRRLVPRKETPQAGAAGAILVRMPAGLGPDRRFFVKLIWSRQDKTAGVVFHPFAADAPTLEGGAVPVLGTTWFVYPPPEVKVTRVGGTLAWLDREPTWWSNVLSEFRIVYGNRRPSADAVPAAGEVPSGMSEIAATFQSRLSFGGRSLAPRVEFAWANPMTFKGLLSLCALAVPILGLLFLRRRRAGAKTVYVIAAIALPLLFLPIAAEGMADVLSAILFGGLVTGVLFIVLGVFQAVFRRPAGPASPAAPATKEV